MRIARILTRMNLGGPARQALAVDPVLSGRGHELRLFAGDPEPGEGDLFATYASRGLDAVRVRGLRRGVNPFRDVLARRRLQAELSAFGPEVVHTHASKAGALGRTALRSGKLSRVARVHTFHGHVLEGYFPEAVSKRLVRFERRLAEETDRVLAVSHATADDLLRLGVTSEEKLVVVPPGIDLAPLLAIERPRRAGGALRTLLGLDGDALLFGVVGRLAEVKQPERALAVFEVLAERHPELQLVFVGDGELRGSLERKILALDPARSQRVHLVGAREDMPEVLADLDAVVNVSRSEGMPVALIEAAAAGLPVVASDVGGVGELVVHERTGFLAQNDTELSFGIDALCRDARERQAMGGRARMRIERRHAAAVLADRLEEVYRVVCEERASGGAA